MTGSSSSTSAGTWTAVPASPPTSRATSPGRSSATSTATSRHRRRRRPAATRCPSAEAFASAMSALGIGDGDLVVAYDDAGGTVAARLVWMLRALGHPAALLDGGLAAWPEPLETAANRPACAQLHRPALAPWQLATIDEVAEGGSLRGGRRPSGGAVPGRGRADRSPGGPHPRGGQPAHRRPRRPRDEALPGPGRAPAPLRRRRRQDRAPKSSPTAARASTPATPSWPWSGRTRARAAVRRVVVTVELRRLQACRHRRPELSGRGDGPRRARRSERSEGTCGGYSSM